MVYGRSKVNRMMIGQCSGMVDNVVKMFPFSLSSPMISRSKTTYYINHQNVLIYPTSTVRSIIKGEHNNVLYFPYKHADALTKTRELAPSKQVIGQDYEMHPFWRISLLFLVPSYIIHMMAFTFSVYNECKVYIHALTCSSLLNIHIHLLHSDHARKRLKVWHVFFFPLVWPLQKVNMRPRWVKWKE